jgi:hypothetical protein
MKKSLFYFGTLLFLFSCKKESNQSGLETPGGLQNPAVNNVSATFSQFGAINSTCSNQFYYSTIKIYDPAAPRPSDLNLFESGWTSVKCPPPPPPPQELPFGCKDYKHPVPNPYYVYDPKIGGVSPKPPCEPIEDILKRIGYFFERKSATEVYCKIKVLATGQTLYQAILTYNTNSQSFKKPGNTSVAITNQEMVNYHNTKSVTAMGVIVVKLFNFYSLELKS